VLFNFNLVPVEKVSPWGKAGSYSLHWFGLTDAEYWIQVGDTALFEYSENARAAGTGRYVEYQVVRLYEDLLEMLPYILEPVPTHLIQYFTGETARVWENTYSDWCDRNCDLPDKEQVNRIFDAAIARTGKRWLDSSFLTPSASIRIWSDASGVHIDWDNRKKMYAGLPAWTADHGTIQLSRSEFIDEVRSFHSRLMTEMSARVERVLAGALSSEINVDLPGLVREHDQRTQSLDIAMRLSGNTDWSQTEWAIQEILKGSG